MCPLRVFVILFSIIVAVFCLFPGAESSKPQKKRSWRELIFDVSTGRYLYQYWYGTDMPEKEEDDDDSDSDDDYSDDEEDSEDEVENEEGVHAEQHSSPPAAVGCI